MILKKRLSTTGYYVVSAVIAVVSMIPFLWMISTSLKTQGAVMTVPIQWIPEEPTLQAYVDVFTTFSFARTVANSLFIAVTYTGVTLLSSSMAAFAFTKIHFRGHDLLLKVYLATMMIPTQVTMIPLFVVMNRLGLINPWWGHFLCYGKNRKYSIIGVILTTRFCVPHFLFCSFYSLIPNAFQTRFLLSPFPSPPENHSECKSTVFHAPILWNPLAPSISGPCTSKNRVNHTPAWHDLILPHSGRKKCCMM